MLTPRPERPGPDLVETNVVTTDAGVTIYLGLRSAATGSPGSPGSTEVVEGPQGPVCVATATNITQGHWAQQGLQEHPGSIPYAVSCDDGYFGIAWVPSGAPGDPSVVVEVVPEPPVDPLAVAQSLLGTVPLPPIAVGANPATGLVALPSWFWVEGYGGAPLTGSETLGGVTVEVAIVPERYDWTFGDGSSLSTTSLGRPYPQESDVRHTYEQSSFSAGGAFQVRVEVSFRARFRITAGGDGAWQELGPLVRSYTRAYPVQQLQAVLTAGHE